MIVSMSALPAEQDGRSEVVKLLARYVERKAFAASEEC